MSTSTEVDGHPGPRWSLRISQLWPGPTHVCNTPRQSPELVESSTTEICEKHGSEVSEATEMWNIYENIKV